MTIATTQFPARRPMAAIAAVTAILLLACAACGSGAPGRPSGSPAPSPSATASSCEATVLVLLSESAQAVQNGYPSGLDPNVVMNRYGEQSAVFHAWIQLDGQVLASQAERGPSGLLTPFIPEVISLCKQYGGQPGPGSPAS